MNKIIVLASCIALAACSKGEAPAESDSDTAPEAVAASEDSMAGTYEATYDDGTKSMTVMTDDGKYTETGADGKVTTGEISMVNGQTCFNSSEEGSAPECWTDGDPAEDGSWVATNDDGVKVTVRKVEDAAAPAAE